MTRSFEYLRGFFQKEAESVPQFLWYATVAAVPWQTTWIWREVFVDGEKWQYATVAVNLSLLLALLTAVATVVFSSVSGQGRFLTVPRFCAAVAVFYLLGLVLWRAVDPALSLWHLFVWIVAAAFAYTGGKMLAAGRVRSRTTTRVLVASLTLSALIGLGQFFTQETFSSVWLGMAEHPVWRGGTAVLWSEEGRFLRAYGAQTHPNIFGVLSALGAILALREISRGRRRGVFLFSWLILVSAVTVSFSRTGWLVLALGTAAVVLTHRFRTRKISELSLPLAGAVIVIGLLVSPYADLYLSRLEAQNRFERQSVEHRLGQVEEALVLIRQNPLTGVAPGGYVPAVVAADGNSRPIWAYQPVHNIFLLLWAETGLVGLFLIIAAITAAAVAAARSRRRGVSVFSQRPILAAALGLLLSAGMFDHWPLTSQTGVLLTALLAVLFFRPTSVSAEREASFHDG